MRVALGRWRLVAGMAALVGGLALDWQVGGGARYAAHAAARERLVARRAELAAARRQAAARGDAKAALRSALRALRRAEARLPDQREMGALLAAVAAEARRDGLVLVALRPKPDRATADHLEAPVELELRGTFADTASFLRRLLTIGRLVHVRELRLGRGERAEGRVILHGRALLSTYRLPATDGSPAAGPEADRG